MRRGIVGMRSRLSPEATTQLLSRAVEQIWTQRKKGARLEITPTTVLVGAGSPLDSLLLLNFLVAVEERLTEEHGLHIDLVDLLGDVSDDESPLKNVGTLTEHLVSISGAS